MKILPLPFTQSHPLSSLVTIETAAIDTIRRKGRRWLAVLPSRRQLSVIAGFGVLTLIATGAIQVSTAMRDRPQRAQSALHQAESWSQDITAALPLHQRAAWESVVKQDPALLVDLCTVNLPSSR